MTITDRCGRNVFAALVMLLLFACDTKPAEHSAGTNINTPPRQYRAPSDGKLTDAQILTYIKVKRRILKPRPEGGAGILTAGEYLQQALAKYGITEPEYDWVQEKIIQAATRLMLTEVYALNESIINKLDGALRFNTQRIARETDPQERQLLIAHGREIRAQLQELRQQHAARTRLTPALAHNMSIVGMHMAELSEVKSVSAYYAAQLPSDAARTEHNTLN